MYDTWTAEAAHTMARRAPSTAKNRHVWHGPYWGCLSAARENGFKLGWYFHSRNRAYTHTNKAWVRSSFRSLRMFHCQGVVTVPPEQGDGCVWCVGCLTLTHRSVFMSSQLLRGGWWLTITSPAHDPCGMVNNIGMLLMALLASLRC